MNFKPVPPTWVRYTCYNYNGARGGAGTDPHVDGDRVPTRRAQENIV